MSRTIRRIAVTLDNLSYLQGKSFVHQVRYVGRDHPCLVLDPRRMGFPDGIVPNDVFVPSANLSCTLSGTYMPLAWLGDILEETEDRVWHIRRGSEPFPDWGSYIQ